MIRHRSGGMCDTLKIYSNLHETNEVERDAQDVVGGVESLGHGNTRRDDPTVSEPVTFGTDNTDTEEYFEEYLDRLHRGEIADDEEGPADVAGELPSRSSGDVTVVHVNGVHHLPVLTCDCRGSDQVSLDLSYHCFLPTTMSKLSTMFTMAVLDDFWLANLECKASAYQYWQRLRRMTKPLEPDQVVDRYKELLRMARLWRWMKKIKWVGFGVVPGKTADGAVDGELTIFCLACPQPGINIPDDWKEHEDR
jgi:hypothetical protein